MISRCCAEYIHFFTPLTKSTGQKQREIGTNPIKHLFLGIPSNLLEIWIFKPWINWNLNSS